MCCCSHSGYSTNTVWPAGLDVEHRYVGSGMLFFAFDLLVSMFGIVVRTNNATLGDGGQWPFKPTLKRPAQCKRTVMLTAWVNRKQNDGIVFGHLFHRRHSSNERDRMERSLGFVSNLSSVCFWHIRHVSDGVVSACMHSHRARSLYLRHAHEWDWWCRNMIRLWL